MELLSAYVFRARRIRLAFSEALASGAYSTSLYTVTSEDSSSTSPVVRAVYAVAGQPAIVELILDIDLFVGSAYIVTCASIPAASTGTFSGTARVIYSAPQPTTNIEPIVSDYDIILYGRDLVWNGKDFEEGADGDLTTISGIPNAVSALRRRFLGSPLPYLTDYSPNSREFVDSNDASPLGARLKQQAMRDTRVVSVKVEATQDQDGDTVFVITPKLVGDRTAQPISITVDS